jgi:hypothetical protein
MRSGRELADIYLGGVNNYWAPPITHMSQLLVEDKDIEAGVTAVRNTVLDDLIAKMEAHASRYPDQSDFYVIEDLDSPDDELLFVSDDQSTLSVGGAVARYLRTLRPESKP